MICCNAHQCSCWCAGKEREGRLCKLQGVVIHRETKDGEVKQRLLRVSNLGQAAAAAAAGDEVFTTTTGTNLTMGTVTETEARALCGGAGAHLYTDIAVVLMSERPRRLSDESDQVHPKKSFLSFSA